MTQLTVHRQKRNKFFGLCQTEVGDVFKIDFDLNKAGIDGFVMDTTGTCFLFVCLFGVRLRFVHVFEIPLFLAYYYRPFKQLFSFCCWFVLVELECEILSVVLL